MTTVPFDTLKLATKLEQTGFTSDQARGTATALAEALSDEMVTKTYFDSRLDATKADLDSRLTATKADLDTRIEATKADILKWMFGQTLVILGAVIALGRFGH